MKKTIEFKEELVSVTITYVSKKEADNA